MLLDREIMRAVSIGHSGTGRQRIYRRSFLSFHAIARPRILPAIRSVPAPLRGSSIFHAGALMFKALTTILILSLAFSGVVAAQKAVVQLPRISIDTTWHSPVGGTTWAAHTSAQLTSALQTAAPGDTVVLDAGVIYSGNFVVPAKSNANKKWIYVTSSGYWKLPGPGVRISP